MHIPYEKKLNHGADFRVTYRFYDKAEGGRERTPYQDYRSDFWYDHPEHHGNDVIFMIWPEFENGQGNIIMDKEKTVENIGTAQMWIINEPYRSYHLDKIVIGLKGYFMEGTRRVAECEVVEILNISTNPRQVIEIYGKKYL